MTALTISMVAPALPFFPVWIAQQKGMFDDAGLQVTVEVTGRTDLVTTSLARGDSQLAMVTPEGVVVDAASGGTLRLVAGNTNRAPLSLIAQPHITTIEGLRGKTIGTSSLKEGTAVLVQRMLASRQLRYPGDYDFALVGAHPQRWEHLQSKTIDAGLQLVPYNYLAEESGYVNLGNAWDHVPDYAFSAIAVDNSWARSEVDLVSTTLAALRAATVWTADHLQDAALVVAGASHSSVEHSLRGLRDLFAQRTIAVDLRINPRALDSVFDSVREAHLLDHDVPLAWDMCVEDSYLPAL